MSESTGAGTPGARLTPDALARAISDPRRLASLRATGLLDSAAEEAFDRLTRLASALLGAPSASFTLIDADRQFFKSAVGHGPELAAARQTPLSHSYCQYVVAIGAPLAVEDARTHPLLHDNPAIAEYGAIAYMGVPVCGADSQAVGTLCVFDGEPRQWRAEQVALLSDLAAGVVAELELRAALRQARERKAALRAEREFLRAVLESAADPLVACDPEGRVTMLNRAARAWAGLRDDDAPAAWDACCTLRDRRGEAPTAADEHPLRRALAGESVRAAEHVLVAPTGERVVLASAEPFAADDGRPLGAVLALQDVTERTLTERRKSEFVSMVSHELRTPLTSIRGALGLLDGGACGELPAGATKLVRVARTNTERLGRLVNDVLDLEKIEAGKLEYRAEEIPPAELVASAVAAMRPAAEGAGVRLVERVDDAVPLRGDRDRLLQVLLNLVSNAVKFAPAGSCVVVRAAATPDGVRVAVEDAGPGIAAAQLPLLFQKFRQLEGAHAHRAGGSGLGLAIAKAIVEAHGGRVGVSSTPGVRTEFWMELPTAA